MWADCKEANDPRNSHQRHQNNGSFNKLPLNIYRNYKDIILHALMYMVQYTSTYVNR